MKNISNFQKYIFKSILIFFVFLFSISKTLFANEIFILKNEGLSTLPPSYLEFLEGYDENISFSELKKNTWNNSIQDPQSFINGYWVKYRIKNQLNSKEIGINHNWNKEKKIFISNSLGVTEFDYWKLGKHNWIDDDNCENILPVFEPYEYDKENPGVEIKLIKNGNKTKKKPSSSSD